MINESESKEKCNCFFDQSFERNGWTKLPNGLIMQWGILGGAAGVRTINFPIAFPKEFLNISLTAYATQTSGSYDMQWVNNTDVKSAKISCSNKQTVSWFAVGY